MSVRKHLPEGNWLDWRERDIRTRGSIATIVRRVGGALQRRVAGDLRIEAAPGKTEHPFLCRAELPRNGRARGGMRLARGKKRGGGGGSCGGGVGGGGGGCIWGGG